MKDNYLRLVNEKHPLSFHDIPQHLVLAPFSDKDIYLHPVAAKNFERLLRNENLTEEIILLDGYRSNKQQQEIWNFSLDENGLEYTSEFVARAGCSEHQTGLALDIGLKGTTHDKIAPYFNINEKVVRKFLSCMQAYGFILRYPKGKEELTGIGYEPWHFRYVGTPHSEIITKYGWTLEEYIDFLETTHRLIA